MKFIHLFALLMMLVCCTSCGQNQTNGPLDKIKSIKANYSDAQLKEADTSQVPMSMVRNVRQDRNGNILIASYLGVFRYDIHLPDRQGDSFTNLTNKISSPRFSSFWDVLEDRKGNLWFATKDSGVYFYNAQYLPDEQESLRHFTTKDGLASNTALHIYEDRTGNIWFGTQGGASRYDGNSFRTFTTEDGLPNNDINTILEDKAGKLWFGSRGDLSVYDGKTFTILKNKDGKTFSNVWGITEDRKGNIWFGATIIEDKRGDTLFVSQGLWRYDGSIFTKVSQKGANAIIEDKNGNIWTTGADEPPRLGQVWSLSRYDQKSLYDKNPSVTEIKSQTGMLLGILEDVKGNIWFGSGGGVHRYDGKTIKDFRREERNN